jgi:hypothetical protein
MQWIQDPSQSNVDNLNNVRREASRHFRNKKKAYLKAKIEELETNSKMKISGACIGASETSRTNIVNDGQGDLVADSHSIFARWKNYFSQILSDVRQTEIHTAKPLVPEPSTTEFVSVGY